MEQKTSSFDRVLGAWDILVIAFGAMIGWGWVVSTGTWIQDGGILTVIIGAAGILLIVASTITGSVSTLAPQAFVGSDTGTTIKAVLAVAVMTPFYFIGFDVIPQAAEEIKVPLKKIGSILILSVVCAVLFYGLVIVAVGLVLTGPEILASENGTGLVTADAMAKAMNSATMAKVIIIGGMCGIITSWNSFLMGGSRALYSMAESYMVPKFFAKLHPQYKTPVNALYVIPNSGATRYQRILSQSI
ncbi:MAG: APC family permease [Mitsuokella multacida]|nr:APC family permease [Mitsuokella multacida]